MTLRDNVRFACIGWLAGVLVTLGLVVFVAPSLIGARPIRSGSDLAILGLIVLLVAPATLLGGLLGGRLPREGGRSVQIVMAAIIGGLFAIPFSCAALWFTGW